MTRLSHEMPERRCAVSTETRAKGNAALLALSMIIACALAAALIVAMGMGPTGATAAYAADDNSHVVSNAEMTQTFSDPAIKTNGFLNFIVDEHGGTFYSPNITLSYDTDEQGNVAHAKADVGERICNVSYSFDANGFPEALSVSTNVRNYEFSDMNNLSTELEYSATASFHNEFDERGRLSKAVMSIDSFQAPKSEYDDAQSVRNIGSITAVYSYYGDSDNVKDISYTNSLENAAASTGGSYDYRLDDFINDLHAILPRSFAPFYIMSMSYTEVAQIAFSEDGQAIRYSYNSGDDQLDWRPPKFPAVGQDKHGETFGSSGLPDKTLTYSYDSNGCLTDLSFCNADGWQREGRSKNITYAALHYSYREVTTPSRAVQTFNRLNIAGIYPGMIMSVQMVKLRYV